MRASIITEVRPMIPSSRIPTHPGEVLRDQYLDPLGMTQVALAEHLSIPLQRVNGIVRGKRAVTPETAWLFALAFDTSPEFWLNLQGAHDLASCKPRRRIKPVRRVG
jgi:addiction module HigA family antidote